MDEKQFDMLSKKLDTIARLLAFSMIKDKSVTDQIDLLTKAKLKAGEIADILGKSENLVYVTQNKLRRRKESIQDDSQSMLGEEGNV